MTRSGLHHTSYHARHTMLSYAQPYYVIISYILTYIHSFNYTIANTSGGTDLTMTGTDFGFVGSSDVRIWINTIDECTGVQWLDDKTLTCQLPPGREMQILITCMCAWHHMAS